MQALKEHLLPAQHDSEDSEASGPRAPKRKNQTTKSTEWMTAVGNALVISLMNLVQAFIFAELVCRGTQLDPCLVAPLQLFGMIVSQAVFLVRSRIARFAIASADVFFALLCHQVVMQTISAVRRDAGLYLRKDGDGFDEWSHGCLLYTSPSPRDS